MACPARRLRDVEDAAVGRGSAGDGLDGRVVDPSTMLDTRLGPVEFWANWICAALWFGNGYVYAPTRDAAGAPQPPLWQLHPHRCASRTAPTGWTTWRCRTGP